MSLWRHRDFMHLWAAESVSQIGSQVTILALPLTAILVLGATPFQVGLLGTIAFLPFILVGLPAGVWVDRLRRRPILIVADIGRALALATIPLAYAFDVLGMGQLYAVAFVAGVLTVFFDVAYMSYLPSLVGREQLVEGNGKMEISRSGAQISGPGLAGALTDLFRAPAAIALDAASYLVSALFVLRIRRPEPPVAHHADSPRPRMRTDIAAGLRYVGRHRLLRNIAACTALSNLFGQMTQAVLLVFAVRELGMSAGMIGFVLSVASVGALLAALTSGRFPVWIGVGPTIVGSIALGSVANLIVPLVGRSSAAPLLITWAMVVSFASVVYNVNQASLRQAITPQRMQGRMNASMRFFVWGTIPIGSFVGGSLGALIGLRPTLVLAALGGLTAVLPVLLSDVRGLREVPTDGQHVQEEEDMTTKQQIVHRYMDGFRHSDHAAILGCLTDDVVWRIHGWRTTHGKAEFDDEIENPAFEGSPELTVERTIDAGDVVVVTGTGVGHHRENGSFRFAYGDLFTFRDDLIAQVDSYVVPLSEAVA